MRSSMPISRSSRSRRPDEARRMLAPGKLRKSPHFPAQNLTAWCGLPLALASRYADTAPRNAHIDRLERGAASWHNRLPLEKSMTDLALTDDLFFTKTG